MPRKPRVFIDGGIYHVYCRASRGEAVFADEAEATEIIGYVKSLNVVGSAAWVGEKPSRLPWWKAEVDEPVSLRDGGVSVDYLARSTAPERPHQQVEAMRDLGDALLGERSNGHRSVS